MCSRICTGCGVWSLPCSGTVGRYNLFAWKKKKTRLDESVLLLSKILLNGIFSSRQHQFGTVVESQLRFNVEESTYHVVEDYCGPVAVRVVANLSTFPLLHSFIPPGLSTVPCCACTRSTPTHPIRLWHSGASDDCRRRRHLLFPLPRTRNNNPGGPWRRTC